MKKRSLLTVISISPLRPFAGIDIFAFATLLVTLSEAALPIALADAERIASAVFNVATLDIAGFFVAAGFCAITGPESTATPNAIDINNFILDS